MNEIRNKKISIPIKKNQIISGGNIELIDYSTGEVESIDVSKIKGFGNKSKKPKNGVTKYSGMDIYHRRSSKAWGVLREQTTPREYIVADKLACMAQAFTSSLEPLSDDLSIRDIAKELNENKDTIKKSIDKLFNLKVLSKFNEVDLEKQHTKYWVFNCFLSFNGDVIVDDIQDLFSDTIYALIQK